MKAYVRVEQNCGPEMPLYAASGSIGEFETFKFDDNLQLTTTETEVSVLAADEIEEGVSVYPNPFQDDINIEIQTRVSGHVSIELLDMSGRILRQQDRYIPYGNQSFSLNAADHTSGTYTLIVYSYKEDGKAEVIRLIKK